MRPPFDAPCTIRSASFNNDIAAELLLELQHRYLPPPALAARIEDALQHMDEDARALEALYQSIARRELLLVRQV
ncbi:hypothetical protein LNN38_26515 [Pseudomonas sp. LA21]|uniref:hypothetical protein n=1 Tax=unclassified Pseudomonas TaxID=196821 RepID=UPI001A9D5250|nr:MULTISPECIES: hypothetical protein [unclassified Pseudomonas]MCJ1888428.1 hypothetical protein [Pseudomonas sp. LA21]